MQHLQKTQGYLLQAKSFSLFALGALQLIPAPLYLCGCIVSHLPYILPRYVYRKSFVCHSYENTRGVGVFFPFWNSALVTHHSPLLLLQIRAPHPRPRRERKPGLLVADKFAARGYEQLSPPYLQFKLQSRQQQRRIYQVCCRRRQPRRRAGGAPMTRR